MSLLTKKYFSYCEDRIEKKKPYLQHYNINSHVNSSCSFFNSVFTNHAQRKKNVF